MKQITRSLVLPFVFLIVGTPASTACEDCGTPHITLLGVAESSAYEASDWMKALKRRGLVVNSIDCRSNDPSLPEIIGKSNVVLVDGPLHRIRTWKPLLCHELEKYLDAGKPVGFLWHNAATQDGNPSALEARLKAIAGIASTDVPVEGALTGGTDHRNHPHCILRGVDLDRLAAHLKPPFITGREVSAVVSADAANTDIPVIWTTSHRSPGGRVGNIFVVQAADAADFRARPHSQLVANAIFWAMDWDDLIPATGVPLQ